MTTLCRKLRRFSSLKWIGFFFLNLQSERQTERRSEPLSSILGGTTHSGPGNCDWKGQERGKDGGELVKSYFGKFLHVLRRAVRHFNAVS